MKFKFLMIFCKIREIHRKFPRLFEQCGVGAAQKRAILDLERLENQDKYMENLDGQTNGICSRYFGFNG